MFRKNMVNCPVCHERFFKHSIRQHVKRCKQKYDSSHTKCELCAQVISNDQWDEHMNHCAKRMGPLEKSAKRREAAQRKKIAAAADRRAVKERQARAARRKQAQAHGEPSIFCNTCESVCCVSCSDRVNRLIEQANRYKLLYEELKKKQSSRPGGASSLAANGSSSNSGASPAAAAAAAAAASASSAGSSHTNDVAAAADNEVVAASASVIPGKTFESVLQSALLMEGSSDPSGHDGRVPCDACGRKFAADRVQIHHRVCDKINKKKKRKIWNGSKKRLEGTVFEEMEQFKKKSKQAKREAEEQAKRDAETKAQASIKWRQEADAFRAVIEANKQKKGEVLVEPEVSIMTAGKGTKGAVGSRSTGCGGGARAAAGLSAFRSSMNTKTGNGMDFGDGARGAGKNRPPPGQDVPVRFGNAKSSRGLDEPIQSRTTTMANAPAVGTANARKAYVPKATRTLRLKPAAAPLKATKPSLEKTSVIGTSSDAAAKKKPSPPTKTKETKGRLNGGRSSASIARRRMYAASLRKKTIERVENVAARSNSGEISPSAATASPSAAHSARNDAQLQQALFASLSSSSGENVGAKTSTSSSLSTSVGGTGMVRRSNRAAMASAKSVLGGQTKRKGVKSAAGTASTRRENVAEKRAALFQGVAPASMMPLSSSTGPSATAAASGSAPGVSLKMQQYLEREKLRRKRLT